MNKYSATFIVHKSFEVEVVFEAPNAEIANEMANDMTNDDDFDFEGAEEIGVDSITLDDNPSETDNVRVSRNVHRWCESWLKDREEEDSES